jgi:hypothetical protein
LCNLRTAPILARNHLLAIQLSQARTISFIQIPTTTTAAAAAAAMVYLLGTNIYLYHLQVRKPLGRFWRSLNCASLPEAQWEEYEGVRVQEGSRRVKVCRISRAPIPLASNGFEPCLVQKPLRRLGRILVCAPKIEYEEYEFEGARVQEGSRRTKVHMDMRPPIPFCAPLMVPSAYWDEERLR